jgi:thiamine biosynthesis lipoprotein
MEASNLPCSTAVGLPLFLYGDKILAFLCGGSKMKKMDLFRYPCIMNRRAFLKISGIMGLGAASSALVSSPAHSLKFDRNRYNTTQTRITMGTFVSMTLVHESRDQAEEAMAVAYAEIDRITGLLSRFDQNAAVAQLNARGYLKDVPPELRRIITRSQGYYKVSGGAFDITVKPVVDLFQETLGGDMKVVPSEKEVRERLDLVGTHLIQFDGETLGFRKPGMGITLDGIAKGYIVDMAAGVLSQSGISSFIVNAGGDIRARGARPDGEPWTIAIQDPEKRMAYPDIIHLSDGAIATSGNYEVFFDNEKMFHHIVDPRTGTSPNQYASVSVLAKSTTQADALSTSVFVMPPERGVGFINAMPASECLIVPRNGAVLRSRGWRSAAI